MHNNIVGLLFTCNNACAQNIPNNPILLDIDLQNYTTHQLRLFFQEVLYNMSNIQLRGWLLTTDSMHSCILNVIWKHSKKTQKHYRICIENFLQPFLQRIRRHDLYHFLNQICVLEHIETLTEIFLYLDTQSLAYLAQHLSEKQILFIIDNISYAITEEFILYVPQHILKNEGITADIEKVIPRLNELTQQSPWFSVIADNIHLKQIECILTHPCVSSYAKTCLMRTISTTMLLHVLLDLKDTNQLFNTLYNHSNYSIVSLFAKVMDETLISYVLLHMKKSPALHLLIYEIKISILQKAISNIFSNNFSNELILILQKLDKFSQRRFLSCTNEVILVAAIEQNPRIPEIIQKTPSHTVLSIATRLHERKTLFSTYEKMTTEDKKKLISCMTAQLIKELLYFDCSLSNYELVIYAADIQYLSCAIEQDLQIQNYIIKYSVECTDDVIKNLSYCHFSQTLFRQLVCKLLTDKERIQALFNEFGNLAEEFIKDTSLTDPIFSSLCLQLEKTTLEYVFLAIHPIQIIQFLEQYIDNESYINISNQDFLENLLDCLSEYASSSQLNIVIEAFYQNKLLIPLLEKIPDALQHRLLWNASLDALSYLVLKNYQPIKTLEYANPSKLYHLFQNTQVHQHVLDDITENNLQQHKKLIQFFNTKKLMHMLTENVGKNKDVLNLLIKKTSQVSLLNIHHLLLEQGLIQPLADSISPSLRHKLITCINRQSETYNKTFPFLSQSLQKELLECKKITTKLLHKDEMHSVIKELNKWNVECEQLLFPENIKYRKQDASIIISSITATIFREMQKNTTSQNSDVYIARIHNTVQGIAICTNSGKYISVNSLISNPVNLHPAFRCHSGVGTSLITHIALRALNQNCNELSLISLTGAVPFYTSLGFQEDGISLFLDPNSMQALVNKKPDTHILIE